MRKLLPLLLLAACAGQAAPPPSSIRLRSDGKADGNGRFAPYHCPDGARFATNGADGMFCLFEDLHPPDGSVETCDLAAHELGFQYPADEPYTCPPPSEGGDGSCRYTVSDAPPNAEAYCEYLQLGYLGYFWELCPPSATVGESRCTIGGFTPPPGARPYCDYLSLGYFGFYWPVGPDETPSCPAGFVYADNGAGDGFCLVENLAIPAELQLRAECDELAAGKLAFSW